MALGVETEPCLLPKVKVAAVSTNKSPGQQIEEAIQGKLQRKQKNETKGNCFNEF